METDQTENTQLYKINLKINRFTHLWINISQVLTQSLKIFKIMAALAFFCKAR